ncbi:MAG: US12 family protein [Planctomycetes bacterium]|nr:US12 family protein [Planctomycetota bacterium]MCW8135938.1 US12 family protein [Planctomycetota bacterium]
MYDNNKYGGRNQPPQYPQQPQQAPPHYGNYGPVPQAQPYPTHAQPYGDPNLLYADQRYEGDLADPAIAAFAKRVYGYFAGALATATVASTAGVFATEHFLATQNYSALGTMRITALVLYFASFLAVVFMRKSHSPLKTGLLFVFATTCGVMIAPMLTFFLAEGMGMSIIFAFGIATVVFGGLSVYVLATGKDFRGLGGYLFAGLILALGLILLNIFVPFPDAISRLVMAGILILFVGYTLYDTSKVTRDYYYRNDAAGAALMLFYDFFILFWYILQILGASRR